jgi:hypothetical protein
MTGAFPGCRSGGLPGPASTGVAIRQKKEVFPHGHAPFPGFCLDQVPFRVKILKSAAFPFRGVGNRAARAFAPAAPGPFIRHYRAIRCSSRIITLAKKQAAAAVRHFILKACNCSFVILRSFLNRAKVNRRRLLSAASCYLIAVCINTIKVPIAASASSRLDIAVIHSVTLTRWLFFFLILATHCYRLFRILDKNVTYISSNIKPFFLKAINFFRGALWSKKK